MALGTATVVKKVAGDGPLRADLLRFAGDGAYSAGGTAAFQAYVRSALGVGSVEVLAVVPQECGGYVPIYDQANDKLKVYTSNGAAPNPLLENTTANLSGTTFNVLVISH